MTCLDTKRSYLKEKQDIMKNYAKHWEVQVSLS